MANNMRLEQEVTPRSNGLTIKTVIYCGLWYESEHTIPYATLAAIIEGEHDSFVKHVKRLEAMVVFKKVWEHING